MMKITFFQRKSYPHQYSIEKIFDGIREFLKHENGLTVENKVLPHFSTGIVPRIKNVFWSSKHQGDVNHITGDVHYIAMGLDKRKTILTIHDLYFLNHPNRLVRFGLKLFWLTLPLKKISYITVISEATKKNLLSRVKFPEGQVEIIPNYYQPTFKASPREFNEANPRILQIGTKENKNVVRLVQALDGIKCHLVIAGEANEKIKAQLELYKTSFTWLQNLSETELIEQYQQCDMLSFMSTAEGFGVPILEAQAVGRPVITSNVSSMPEVASDAACYVDPFDIVSMRSGILKVVHDEAYRLSLIEKGYANVKRFELTSIAKMYLDLYQKVYLHLESGTT